MVISLKVWRRPQCLPSIHGAPKVSFDSHLGLRNLVHAGHYVLDGQCFKFLGDVLPAIVHVGLGELEDPCYAFPVAYQNAKVSGR